VIVLLAATLFLAVIGHRQRAGSAKADSLDIVFVGRYDRPSLDDLHARLIGHLIEDYNAAHPTGLKLRFVSASRKAYATADTAVEPLIALYDDLAQRPRVLAVIDNCWGIEIEKAKESIRKVQSPVIFLNADRNGNDFGGARFARLFLGDEEAAKDQMSLLLPELERTSARKDVGTIASPVSLSYVFAGETEYAFTGRFFQALRDHQLSTQRKVELPGKPGEVPAPAAIETVKSSLLSYFPTRAEPKLLVLSCHYQWGDALLPWLDQTFDNLTVVGYQSINSRGHAPFARPTNQLIILGQSSTSVSDVLMDALEKQQALYPELYGLPDDLLYVRRCVLAVDLVSLALDERKPDVPGGLASHGNERPAAASTISERLSGYVGEAVRTSLGEVHFDERGAETGNNHILLYRSGTVFSYPKQFNAAGTLVPNIQFGFKNVRISNIDVAAGQYHADFYFWIRYEPVALRTLCEKTMRVREGAVADASRGEASVVPVLIDFFEHTADGYQVAAVSSQTFGKIEQTLFHVTGNFVTRIDGSWYPADTGKLSIEMRVAVPDDELRICPDQYETAPQDTARLEIDGWTARKMRMTVNSQSSNDALVPLGDLADNREKQYSNAGLTVSIRRRLWGPAFLVCSPLALLTLASLAVLYIKLPAGQATALEQQNELTLVCMLSVVTYLVSYATLAPRVAQSTLADWLVGFVLGVSVANFIFCVAVSHRITPGLFAALTLPRFRRFAVCVSVGGFVIWTAFVLTHWGA
jgi:hypothetical protein